MRIAVFGANGRTGQVLCAEALGRGHEITAYVRDKAKMAVADPRFEVVEGTLDNVGAMARALQGADAVVLALGTTDRKPNTVLSDGTRAIIDAMKTAGVEHLAAITSMGCGDSKSQVNSRIMRLVIKTFAKEIWADKNRQEAAIRASGLDYLIVRPGGLTEKPARGSWTELRTGESYKGSQMIPRADVATYILNRLETPSLGDDTVTLF